jgi:hypothetical protein
MTSTLRRGVAGEDWSLPAAEWKVFWILWRLLPRPVERDDQWFHQHADEEFRLKRLDLDDDVTKETVIRHPAEDAISAIVHAANSVTIPLPGGAVASLGTKGIRQLDKPKNGEG